MRTAVLSCWLMALTGARSADPAGAVASREAPAPIVRPLRPSKNPNYFENDSGRAVVLCGSQTWNTLQDWGTGASVERLNFDAFVTFLRTHGHNFTLLWRTELPRFSNLPVTAAHPPDFTVSPHPWPRTGPGLATDGRLKFNLAQTPPTGAEYLTYAPAGGAFTIDLSAMPASRKAVSISLGPSTSRY